MEDVTANITIQFDSTALLSSKPEDVGDFLGVTEKEIQAIDSSDVTGLDEVDTENYTSGIDDGGMHSE